MCGRFRGFFPVVIDLETGGVDPTTNAVLEICAVLPVWINDQLKVGSVHEWKILPHRSTVVENRSLEINKIDPFDPSRAAISEAEALRELFRTVRRELKTSQCVRAILTGHNAHFDHAFLKAAAARNNIKRDPFHLFSVIDTVALAAVYLGHTVLEQACRRAGIEYRSERAHGARYDAEITAELFCTIVNSSGYSPSADA